MHIEHIRLEGVRHFAAGATIKLREDLTLLVGANGSGKSTVLDALCFALGDRTPSDFVDAGSECCVTLGLIDNGTSIVVRSRIDDRGKRVLEQQSRVAAALPKGPEASTVPELKAFLGTSARTVAKPELVELAAAQLKTLPDGELMDRWTPVPQELVERLPRVTRVDAESMIDVKRSVDDLLSRELQKFLSKNSKTWSTWNDRFRKAAKPATDALVAAVEDQAGDVVDSLTVTASISTDRPRVDTSIVATSGGTEVDLDGLSLGKRRRIALSVADALTGRLGGRPEILLYDEPDAHLDNRSQSRLLRVLRDQAEVGEVQVVVATHAPGVIDAVDVVDLVHVQASDGQAIARSFADLVEDDEDLLVDLDVDLGNTALLHQRVLVVCEGVSEHAALPVLYRRRFGRSLRADGVDLVSKDGCDDAIRFALMLTSVRGDGVLLLLDRDQEQKAEDCLRGTGLAAIYVGEAELEDCFSDVTWATVIADIASEEGVSLTITADDVRVLRSHPTKAISKAIDRYLHNETLQIPKHKLVKRAAESHPLDDSLTGGLEQALVNIHDAARPVPVSNSDDGGLL